MYDLASRRYAAAFCGACVRIEDDVVEEQDGLVVLAVSELVDAVLQVGAGTRRLGKSLQGNERKGKEHDWQERHSGM